MEKKLQILYFLTIIFCVEFIFNPVIVNAQVNCSELIDNVRTEFERGKYERVIKMILERKDLCYDRSQKEEYLNFLASAYLEMDSVEAGNAVIRKLLLNNPFYDTERPGTSSTPFIENLLRYNVRPTISLVLHFGPSYPFPDVTNIYTISQSADYSKKYIPSISYSVALGVQWSIFKDLSLTGELNMLSLSYSREIPDTNGTQINFSENATNIRVPIFFKYEYNSKSKFKPEIYAGGYFNYLFSSNADINSLSYRSEVDFENRTIDQVVEITNSEDNIDMKDLRTSKNWGLLVGLRLGYKIKGFKAFIDGRYSMDMNDFVKAENRYMNRTLVMDYNYVDDDFSFSSVEIGVGFSIDLVYRVKQKY